MRVLYAVLLGAAAVLLAGVPAPARAQSSEDDRSGVFVEVNPSTIQAGSQIGIRASCGDDRDHDRDGATVRSRAFNDVTLTPRPGTRLLSASVTVSPDTRPGEHRVDLRCDNRATATTELFVLDMARPTVGPPAGAGGTAGPPAAVPLLLAGGLAAIGLGAILLRRTRPHTPWS